MATVALRPLVPDDEDAIAALVARYWADAGVPRGFDVHELRDMLTYSWLDVAADTRVAVDDGDILGWSFIWHAPSTSDEHRAVIFGAVDPPARDRGAGRALVAWGVTRATELLRARSGTRRSLRLEAPERLRSAARLFARFGFASVRWFEELERPMTPAIDAPAPVGISIVPWTADLDAALLAVRNAAFADHWGNTPVDADTWQVQVRGHGARVDLSFAAIDDATGAPLGFVLSHAYPEDDVVTGRREAWINLLGTRREARRRGLASALLAHALGAYAEAGNDYAMIGVDRDNQSGAARLYKSLGFTLARTNVTYELLV
jgi:mycothiol synthase